MRLPLLVVTLLLLLGCSSTGEPEASHDSDRNAVAPGRSSSQSDAPDPCQLLKTNEVRRLLETAPRDVNTTLSAAGLPGCQWKATANESGPWVQVIAVDSSEWALSLPDAVRGIERSGIYDAKSLRKLHKSVDLIKAGQDIGPRKACSLFSQMLEAQGRPPGLRSFVTAIPSRANPLGLSGEMCTLGRFTSVLLADRGGFERPFPIKGVMQTTMLVHRRALT